MFVRNHDEMRIEPVLLYPVGERLDEPGAPLRPSSGVPLFNMDAVSYTHLTKWLVQKVRRRRMA